MENESPKVTPILKIAWLRFAELNATSMARSKLKSQLNRGTALAGILVTIYAFVAPSIPTNIGQSGLSSKLILSLIPIIVAALAAYTRMFNSSLESKGIRAFADQILREIYFFRTILQQDQNRRNYLEKRLDEIQLQVFKSMGGELTLKQHTGNLPPQYDPAQPYSDPGFHDLTGNEYYEYRLESQLNAYRHSIKKNQNERIRMQVLIIVACVLIAVLVVTGGIYKVGMELLVSLTIAFLSWQESRNLDQGIKTNSKIVFSLMKLQNHWVNLEPEERTTAEFYKMVRAGEEVLNFQAADFIRATQELILDDESYIEEQASLVNRVIKESVESDKRFKQEMSDSLVEFTRDTLQEAEQQVEETFKAILGSLAEDASSELVQKELEAMVQSSMVPPPRHRSLGSFLKLRLAGIRPNKNLMPSLHAFQRPLK